MALAFWNHCGKHDTGISWMEPSHYLNISQHYDLKRAKIRQKLYKTFLHAFEGVETSTNRMYYLETT